MKKRVILFLFVLIILFGVFALAQENDSEESIVGEPDFVDASKGDVEKAYACLENEIEKRSEGSLSLEEAIFSTLALGAKKELEDIIKNEKSREECWPKSGCNIKKTAQVLLAYDRMGKKSDDVEKWLLSKEINTKELTWYLEIDIDNHAASECTLRYDNIERTINVKDDMKLEGNPGQCLSVSYGGYWLKINENCLEKEFEISCDQDFITTLAYQRGNSGTVFISSETSSSASLGTTNEKVNSKCFNAAGSGSCDYEGTLWSAVALQKIGGEVSPYVPYLLAFADNNLEKFPNAFLYILTGGEEQYSEIIQKQKEGGYWDIPGGENRFYDTSLVMFALGGTNALEVEKAKNYLLSIQTKDGCWNNNNIRDTAFILYSGWAKTVVRDGGGDSGLVLCESAGYYCENPFRCSEASGNLLYNYDCSSSGAGLECCSIRVEEQTCDAKSGLTCTSEQKCTGRIESSADGSCCIDGACVKKQIENICETIAGGTCRTNCFDDEKEKDESCSDAGEICCIQKVEEEKKGISKVWIILLVILIVLLILGIIFRNKIRIWWWSRRGKAKVQRVTRPPAPPGAVMARYSPRPRFGAGMPGSEGPLRRAKSPEDKELDETMKKLKEMSK